MSNVVTLEPNLKGRDFVVGDLHGMFSRLEEAMSLVSFNPKVDRMIALGDLVNRGPESIRCLEFLRQPWFLAVRGSGEDLLMEVYEQGILNFGILAPDLEEARAHWVLTTPDSLMAEIIEAFRKLPVVMQVKAKHYRVGFVHADVPETLSWQSFVEKIEADNPWAISSALGSRVRLQRDNRKGVAGIDRVFVGHALVRGGLCRLGNVIFTNTGAFEAGRPPATYMTLVDVDASDSALEASHLRGLIDIRGDVSTLRLRPLGARQPRPPSVPKPR
jgi:serine/threonine protein phosphatase 1